jgi:hypothetical protein
MTKQGKSKLFKCRKDLDGQFHRGQGGRKAEKARKWKRTIEKSLRQKSKKICRDGWTALGNETGKFK